MVEIDYLHLCLQRHGELCELYFGRRQQLDRVEKAAASIRSSRRLSYRDLQEIVNPELWDAREFWQWPPREDVEDALARGAWDFWNLPKNEVKAVDALLEVFRYVEPVSVLLRFIRPDLYGIFGPEVEKVLELSPAASWTEKYLSYVHDLRALKASRHFESVADVDMALWVLHVGVIGRRLPGAEELEKAFWDDVELRRIRVRNLTHTLFDRITRAQLADALVGVNPELAAQVAGIEFERAVKELANATDLEDLGLVIDRLFEEGRVDGVTKGRWRQRVGSGTKLFTERCSFATTRLSCFSRSCL